MPDVFKILQDLELKAVGLDEQSKKMQEGFFTSFRPVGLPVRNDDFENPFDPLGGSLAAAIDKAIQLKPPADPAEAPKTGSGALTESQILAAQIAKSQKNFLNTFYLTDDKLQMNSQYTVMPGWGKISDAWWAIITGATGIPTESQLTPAMQQAFDAARAKLMDADGNISPHYQAYLNYEDQYETKVKARNRAYANAFTDPMRLQQWPQDGVIYQQDVEEAFDRWTGFGFKNEIQNAMAVLAAQGTDPAIALISRAKKRYENSLLNFPAFGNIPYTMMSPASWYESDNDEGWNEYTSNDFHTESQYQRSTTSYGGGGGINVGFWRAGGSFNHTENHETLRGQTDNLEVRFKYSAVDIIRPWMVTSLLSMPNWFLMGDYKKHCISDGTMGQELPQGSTAPTFLPSVVTSLILIKDLFIRWDNWESDWANNSSSTSAGLSVGIGPFAVSGHYSRGDEQREFEADATGEGLSVPGMQLLGYVSAIMPASPAVDSSQYVEHPEPAVG